jgi:hypothetical protein
MMILYAEVKPGHAFLDPGNWFFDEGQWAVCVVGPDGFPTPDEL